MKRGNIGDHRERTAFVRECVAHYEPMLPRPTEEQYTAIARALLGMCPTLKDSGTHYWVSFYCMATTILSLLLVTDIKYRYYYLNIVHMSGTDCMGYFSTCLSHYIHTIFTLALLYFITSNTGEVCVNLCYTATGYNSLFGDSHSKQYFPEDACCAGVIRDLRLSGANSWSNELIIRTVSSA